jgi:hypothetical protein
MQAVIEVRDSDVEASLDLRPSFSLSGRIIVEPAQGRPAPDASSLVRLRLDYPIANPPQLSAAATADGSFVFKAVPGGDYRVLAPLSPALPNTYVESFRLGDTDVLNGRLRLDRPPEGQMQIIIGTNPGTLRGRVVDNKQQPITAATVVLLPDVAQRLLRTDLYKVTSTDQTGRFELEALPPGDYRLFAWQDVADEAWQDPAFMRAYEQMGSAVRIVEGARQDELSTIRLRHFLAHTPEANVTGRRVDRLSHSRGRTIPLAVVLRAKM